MACSSESPDFNFVERFTECSESTLGHSPLTDDDLPSIGWDRLVVAVLTGLIEVPSRLPGVGNACCTLYAGADTPAGRQMHVGLPVRTLLCARFDLLTFCWLLLVGAR